jgi:hypothetical protein
MNTTPFNQSYKITHAEIKKLTTLRLKNHLDNIKEIKRDFTASEKSALLSTEETHDYIKQQYVNIKRYAYFINLELESRSDYNKVINEIATKLESSKQQKASKGCHHLKKQKKQSL